MDKTGRNQLYGTTEDRINTIGNIQDPSAVYRVFKAVKDMKLEGIDETIKYMTETYGIKLKFIYNSDHNLGGGWDMSFEVVDQELYTLFLLKYT